jgi:hypothetical protein
MKFSPFFILFLCYTIASAAQTHEGDIEISGSAGLPSAVYFISNFDEGFGSGLQLDGPKPAYFISARYYLGKRIAVGLTIGTETITGGTTYDQLYSSGVSYTFNVRYHTVAAEFLFIYKKMKYFQIYTTCGLGSTFYQASGSYPDGVSFPAENNNNPTNGAFWNGYISPFGFRAGRDFAIFMECGIGYKGLVNGGISYRFKTEKYHYR